MDQTNDNGGAVNQSGAPDPAYITFYKNFAQSIGKTFDEVSKGLEQIVGPPSDEAMSLLQNEADTPEQELRAAIGQGVPVGKFKKAVRLIRVSDEVPTALNQGIGNGQPLVISPSFDLLPAIPKDESILSAIQSGGVLKVESAVVLSGVRAALAYSFGYFEIPVRLRRLMETHAQTIEEPVSNEYFELDDMLTLRRHAKLAGMVKNSRRYATVANRKKFVSGLMNNLIPVLKDFDVQLKAWMEVWYKNPLLFAAFVNPANASGLGGMVQPPDSSNLKAAGEVVVNQTNKVFAGLNIPVAMAIALEATEIRKILDNKSLPALIGAANKDLMLKTIGIQGDSEVTQLESSIVQFVLSIMVIPNITPDKEFGFFSALSVIGSRIPWDRITAQKESSLPKKSTAPVRASEEEEEQEEFEDEDEDDEEEEVVSQGSRSGSGKWF